jgi:hypothetical protein
MNKNANKCINMHIITNGMHKNNIKSGRMNKYKFYVNNYCILILNMISY